MKKWMSNIEHKIETIFQEVGLEILDINIRQKTNYIDDNGNNHPCHVLIDAIYIEIELNNFTVSTDIYKGVYNDILWNYTKYYYNKEKMKMITVGSRCKLDDILKLIVEYNKIQIKH